MSCVFPPWMIISPFELPSSSLPLRHCATDSTQPCVALCFSQCWPVQRKSPSLVPAQMLPLPSGCTTHTVLADNPSAFPNCVSLLPSKRNNPLRSTPNQRLPSSSLTGVLMYP